MSLVYAVGDDDDDDEGEVIEFTTVLPSTESSVLTAFAKKTAAD